MDRVQPCGCARLGEARVGDLLGEMSLLDAGDTVPPCRTLTPCVVAGARGACAGPHDERRPPPGRGVAAGGAGAPTVATIATSQCAPERVADQLDLMPAAPGETTMERDQASKFVNDLLRLMIVAQRLRLVPHRRLSARDQGRRQGDQGLAAAADRPAQRWRWRRCGDERQAGAPSSSEPRSATSRSRRRASDAFASTRSCSRGNVGLVLRRDPTEHCRPSTQLEPAARC